ncbi:hypothetical protein TI39_contig480g00005 [Zymoseptoria brevis]|uniref:Uncharacterized protein n=1 Tax=Zymoseptoria brevis TaxID=1047168 RepID=A0A0F4GJL9_9PEZI|nr:hypothetical protein TI39_contig480g00005 [Zymoseptoria brevis]
MSPPTKKQRLLSPDHLSSTKQPQPDSPSSPPPTKPVYSPDTPTLSTGTNHTKFLPSYSALPYSLEDFNLFSRNSPPFLFTQPPDPDFGAKVCAAWEANQEKTTRLQNLKRCWRESKYGKEVADRYSPGATPREFVDKYDREQDEAVRAYMEKSSTPESEGELERQRQLYIRRTKKLRMKVKKLREKQMTTDGKVASEVGGGPLETEKAKSSGEDQVAGAGGSFALEDLSLEDVRRAYDDVHRVHFGLLEPRDAETKNKHLRV